MIKQTKRLLMAVAVSTTALFSITAAQAADMGATGDPIKLALHEWTGQHITTLISGQILERMGYKVEYVTAGYLGAGTALADGNLTGSLEVWDNNLGDFFPKLLDEGKLENLGDTGLDGQEGWLYTDHMAEKCPGLPAWDAFLSCAKEFATAETYPKGRLVVYPASWGDRSSKFVENEGLDFVTVPGGSEGAMVAELKASHETKGPLAMMFWAPHWAFSEVKVHWIDMPQDLRVKGGFVKPNVFKIVWPGTKDKWPAAYEVLKSIRVTNEMQEPIMFEVDNQGKDINTVTKAWIDANEAIWKPWVDAAM